MTDCFKFWSLEDHNVHGDCCCNCQYHREDLHHCTTLDRVAYAIANDVPAPVGCVCSMHKGWTCTGMEGLVYSGWSEHGMCEMHFRKLTVKST